MKPQNENLSNHVDNESGLLSTIFDTVMNISILSTEEYWKSIFNCVKKNKDRFSEFFAEPQWTEIEIWLELHSFKFNSYRNHIDEEFRNLIKKSDMFVDMFKSNNLFDCTSAVGLCFDYLCAYYDLIVSMEQSGILQDDLSYRSAFLQMMMTGYFYPEFDNYSNSSEKGKPICFYRFFSPVFLEKLCLFYDFLEEDGWYNKKSGENKIMTIFRDVIKEKFIHMFFSDVNISGKRYVTTYHNVDFPYLINRDYLSSVESIRPVRWIDKIRAYIESCSDSGQEIIKNQAGKYEIHIAAIGYVNISDREKKLYSEELDMFCYTLNSLYSANYIFDVKIFVNEEDNYFCGVEGYKVHFDNVKISLKKVNYFEFFAPNKSKDSKIEFIGDIIDQNNIVLILDAPNLYTYEYKLFRKSSKDFPDNDSHNYKQEYRQIDFKNDDFLVLGYRYAPIHLLISKINLIAMNADRYEDTLKYKINTPLIDYLQKYVKKKNDIIHDVHVFISSKTSINYSEYAEQNFTREERYNGKNFHLITLRNINKKTIGVYEGKKNYIVFSLWNFMKNIDYHFLEREVFYKNILNANKKAVCAESMYIYIKMKWGDALNDFEFEICCDKKKSKINSMIDKELLKDMISSLLKVVFSSENDLFCRCVRHSFSNTIYSQMEYLDDAVFYCLFCKEFPRKNVPQLKVDFVTFDEKPVSSVNQPVFWTVARSIKNLNTKSFFGDQMLAIKREFRKNSMDYSFGESRSVLPLLKFIVSICEKYGYESSYLYRNIREILD